MAKNLTNFEDFQNKRKSVTESIVEEKVEEKTEEKVEEEKVEVIDEKTERVVEAALVGDVMRVPLMVDVPMSLLKAFATKVKNETGQDIKNGSIWSDSLLSDEIARFIQANYMNIENLPVTLITGDIQKGGVQSQPQAQVQAQVQPQIQPQIQPQPQSQGQAPIQVAPAQTQVPPASGQPTAQQSAQQIPATE